MNKKKKLSSLIYFIFKGHKNCKLFITHGGYHSLVEALHFGLPVIGFPFFTDQYYNMKFVEENGFGIQILLNDLQEHILDDAIRKILFDLRYIHIVSIITSIHCCSASKAFYKQNYRNM